MSDEYWRDQWRISEKRANDFETKLKIAVDALCGFTHENYDTQCLQSDAHRFLEMLGYDNDGIEIKTAREAGDK